MSGTASIGSLVSWNSPHAAIRVVARTMNQRKRTDASMIALNMIALP